MKKIVGMTIATIYFIVTIVTIGGAPTENDKLEKYIWYNGDREEKVYAAMDEVGIFPKDKKNVTRDINSDIKLVKDYEFLTIESLPNQLNITILEDKITEIHNKTGNKANLVFYRDPKKDNATMVLTGEIIVRFKEDWNETKVIEWSKVMGIDMIKSYSFSPNTYLFNVGSGIRSLETANKIYLSGQAIYAYPNWWKAMNTRAIPNDPLFSAQWHLDNTGQGGGTLGEDSNITSVWDRYRGSGNEVIAIVDDGLELLHEDLAPNILPYSWDYIENDNDPSAGRHGTSVAGVAAARGWNLLGVTGAAPYTRLIGYRITYTDDIEASALSNNSQMVDIYSNSWGPEDDRHLEGPGPLTLAAYANGVTNGRGSKGNIYIWAGGNGNDNNDIDADNSNYDGYANSRYVMAIAASDNFGRQSWYSEEGSNILINAPSDGGSLGITTTDRTGSLGYESGNYTSTFGGTSSAAPLVSGIISLMLQANPSLSWRDIRFALAKTAEKNDPTDSDWTRNGAGYSINHKYGFGRINAYTAINTATNWNNLGPEVTVATYRSPNRSIPDNNPTGVSDTIIIDQNISIEFVEINFTSADHTYWGDLEIELISPSGTRSILAKRHSVANSGERYNNWLFGSVRHIGEFSKGTWRLTVRDLKNGDTGTFQRWGLRIYGTTPRPVNTMTLISPNGGEMWQRGNIQTIRWNYTGFPGYYVKIELLKSGALNSVISSSTWAGDYGTGHYDWLILPTQILGNDYKIRITSTSNSAYTDTSNNNFIIIENKAPIEEWNRKFGGTNDEYGMAIKQTRDGGYIIIGDTISYGAGGRDFWFIKTDSSGNRQWNKTFGGAQNDWATSVQQTRDGGYILTGYTESFPYPTPTDPNAWLIKTDNLGSAQWKKTYGETGYANADYIFSVNQTSDGGYILSGQTWSYGRTGDAWLIKTDYLGNMQWNKIFGEEGCIVDCWSNIYSVQQTKDGGYILAGGITVRGTGFGDGWLIKTDYLGNKQWDKKFGKMPDFGEDTVYSVQQTKDGGYILAGLIDGSSWIIKTDSTGNIQWNKTFFDGSAHSVQQTKDGGYILTGHVLLDDLDALLIKTDALGNMQWNKIFRGIRNDEINSVQQTSDGGYILLGTTEYPTWLNKDFWLIKVKGSIVSSIIAISPNGGENWIRGTMKTISWSSSGNPGSAIKIELLKNEILNRTINLSTPNDGSYTWTIPVTQALGNDYKIRITSTSNPVYKDTSDSNFIISSSATIVNLLKNPGFETSYGSIPMYWNKYQTGTRAIFTYPDIGRIGGKSVSIKYLTRETGKVALWQQTGIIVSPSKQYKLSGYMKLEGVTGSGAVPRPGGAGLRVSWYKSDGGLIRTDYINKKGTVGWTMYEKIVTSPSNAVKATVAGDLFDSSGKVWFDDLSFVKIS